MVGCDQTCAYYEISLETPHGQLFATVAMPRVFLANFSSQLSNDEVSLLAFLNAGVPPNLKAGKPKGYRVMHLAGFLTREVAVQTILELSKDCTCQAEFLRKKLSELDQEPASTRGRDQRCRLLHLRLLPLDEEAIKQAEKEQSAGRAGAEAAARTVNEQLQGTAVERAAVMGSNSKLQKTDTLLTHHRKQGTARGKRVVIGGVALKSLSKDLLAAHRSDFCRVSLRLPLVYGLHRPCGDDGQMFARVSRAEKVKTPVAMIQVPAGMHDDDEQKIEESWRQVRAEGSDGVIGCVV